MEPAGSYYYFLRHVAGRLGDRPAAPRPVGLLFCRPESSIAATEILPSLGYYHLRSGRHIDFYFAGYTNQCPDKRERNLYRQPECSHRQFSWWFSDQLFDEFRGEVQNHTSWCYSGGTDLILTQAGPLYHYQADLDYRNAIVIVLEELQRLAQGLTAGMLFERIFRAAERESEAPICELSDNEGLRLGRSALWSLVLSVLPESIRSEASRARHFAVRDISKVGA
ncbi:MAG: hypothetical protein FJ291_04595 [Planctomycetes bacterium]|nr:hypothetical protein [Planctomycetota bacterium]